MALKDQILAANDRKPIPVDMTKYGWPEGVHIMPMSAAVAMDVATISDSDKPTSEEVRRSARLMYMHSLVDADGAQLFTEQDVDKLLAKGARAITYLGDEIRKINLMTEESVDEEGNV